MRKDRFWRETKGVGFPRLPMKLIAASTDTKETNLLGCCVKWAGLAFCAVFLDSCNLFPVNDVNHPALVDSLISEATLIWQMKGVNRARRFLDSAYAHLPDAGIMDRYHKYSFLGKHYGQGGIEGDDEKSGRYEDSLFALFSRDAIQKKYRKEYATIHLLHGDRLHYHKRYDEAYSYYSKGKDLMQALDVCQSSHYTSRVASMYYRQKNFAKAIVFYKKVIQELEHCTAQDGFDLTVGNPQGQLNNIALCFTALGKPDSAIYYYEQALRFIARHEPEYPDHKKFLTIARGVIYGNQGAAYRKIHNYQRAASLLNESIRINTRKGFETRDAQLALGTLSGVYLDDNQIDKARQTLQALRMSLDTLPFNLSELRWREMEWQYWEKVKRPDQALKYLKQYTVLKDSIDTHFRNFEDVNAVLEKKDHEHQIEMLRKNEELNRVYLMVAVSVTVLVVIIALLIWFSWKRTQRNLTESEALNQQISGRNAQLQTTLAELEKSQQENARLLKVVAHDLRTPVGSIHMASDLLLEGQLVSRDPRFFLEMIKTSSTNALDLIDNLLHTNTILDKKQKVDLQDFLESCVDMLQLKATEKKQTIRLRADAIPVMMDRQKMWRVMSNLLINAIKFSPQESTIFVQAKSQGETVLLSVKDPGIGIPVALQHKVFDLFTEAKRPGTAGEKTFGLGLAISRQIVEAHGGKLWFESEENRGSTFYVELPVQ